MANLTEHFTDTELACRCGCGFGTKPDDYAPDFLDFLEILRAIYGRPIHPTSGARCTAHNKAEGGRPLSAHTRAAAADLGATNGYDRHSLSLAYFLARMVKAGHISIEHAVQIAAEIGRTRHGGLGIARGFIHVDVDVNLPRPSVWSYPAPAKKG